MNKLYELGLFGAVGAVAVSVAAAFSVGAVSPSLETAAKSEAAPTGAPAFVQEAVAVQIREQVSASLAAMNDPEKAPCEMFEYGSVLAAPGTPPDVIQDTYDRMMQWLADNPWEGDGPTARFQPGDRWGGIGGRGVAVDLTYSFPPDGIGVSGGANSLNATLDGIYGSTATWKQIFADEFQRWADATGNTYTEVSDDGATWPSAPGPFNGSSSRGDVRIVMGPNDGSGSVLAFNFFPDNGDMYFDVAENWGNGTFFRNVIAHEHGHGLGLNHVCPANSSKLMEPFANFLVGPRFDDRLAGQYLYGDFFEPNNSGGSSVDLAGLGLTNNGIPVVIDEMSLHSSSDFDLFRVEAEPGTIINVQAIPVGPTYTQGPQVGNCNTGSTFIASEIGDLKVDILRPSFSAAASSDSGGFGDSETIQGFTADQLGNWFIRVSSTAGIGFEEAQMYDVIISLQGGTPPDPADIDGNGCVDSTDLAILIAAWNSDDADITGDGVTNASDLAALIASWTGSGC